MIFELWRNRMGTELASMLYLLRRARLAFALMIFVLPLAITLSAKASLTRGDSSSATPLAIASNPLIDEPDLAAPQGNDPALPRQFSISAEPDRVLRQDFHLPPTLMPPAPESSLTSALRPAPADRASASDAPDEAQREDLVVPIPAV